jgi:hypothetical protein
VVLDIKEKTYGVNRFFYKGVSYLKGIGSILFLKNGLQKNAEKIEKSY